jgi:hypothetical protein
MKSLHKNYPPSGNKKKEFFIRFLKFSNNFDELVKSHIPYVVHASTSSARTEYQ